MRLFRQLTLKDWDGVFDKIAEELQLVVQGQREKLSPVACPQTKSIQVEIAPGELVDKITILEIKSQLLTDPGKLMHVHAELELLNATFHQAYETTPLLNDRFDELREINRSLWDVEDRLRMCERNQDFGPEFVELARAVYFTNDRRAEVKRHINELLKARFQEVKSYQEYTGSIEDNRPLTPFGLTGGMLSTGGKLPV